MIGKLLITLAPFVVTAAKIVMTDPAMRNFIIDAVSGRRPSASTYPPTRPHAQAQAFEPCPACKGRGLVPVLEAAPAVSKPVGSEILSEPALLELLRRAGLTVQVPLEETPPVHH